MNLVNTSTSALEHTKNLGLLSASIWDSGGQSITDSLLFGKKVLSTPLVLSNKNVNDLENNYVEGNTTWSHQKSYVKMLTAGC